MVGVALSGLVQRLSLSSPRDQDDHFSSSTSTNSPSPSVSQQATPPLPTVHEFSSRQEEEPALPSTAQVAASEEHDQPRSTFKRGGAQHPHRRAASLVASQSFPSKSQNRYSYPNGRPLAAMRDVNRSVPEGMTVSALAAREEAEILAGHEESDPYTWERPLDTVNRFSQMLDLQPPTAPMNRRGSRLPPGVNLVDPFGFGLSAESSPYDGAMSFSDQQMGPTSSSMFTRSNSSNALASSSAATSPVPWRNDKSRSASAGSAGASRPHLRGELSNGHRGQSYWSDLGAEADSPPITPAALGGVPTASSISLPEVDFTKSRLYQRTLKAQKALEKERAKAAAKGQTLFAEDPIRNPRRGSTLSFLSDTGSTTSEKKRVRKSLGWFRSASEVALPSGNSASPPLPSSHSVSQLPLYPHTTVKQSNIPSIPSSRTTTPPASRNGSRSPRGLRSPGRSGRGHEEEVIAAANARRQASLPVPTAQQQPRIPHSPSNLSASSRGANGSSNGNSPQPSPPLSGNSTAINTPLPDSVPGTPTPDSTPNGLPADRPPRNTSPLKRTQVAQSPPPSPNRQAQAKEKEARQLQQQQREAADLQQRRQVEHEREIEYRREMEQRRQFEERQQWEADQRRQAEQRREAELRQEQENQQRAAEQQRVKEASWSQGQERQPFPSSQAPPPQQANPRQQPQKNGSAIPNDPYAVFDHGPQSHLPPGAAPSAVYQTYENSAPTGRPRKSSLNLLMGAFRKDSADSGSSPSPIHTSSSANSNGNSPSTPNAPLPPAKAATLLRKEGGGFFSRSKKATASSNEEPTRALRAKVASPERGQNVRPVTGKAPSTGDSASTGASQKLVRQKPKNSFFSSFGRKSERQESASTSSSWSETSDTKELPPPPPATRSGRSTPNGGTRARPKERMMASGKA